MAKFQQNNSIHSSTQQTPFMLNTGRHPRMGFEPNQPCSHSKTVNDFADRIAKGLKESKAALVKAQHDYKLYYDHRREPAPDLKPGDKVWLEASDIRTTMLSAKLSH